MFLPLAEIQEMHHAHAVGDEPIGDQGAMAVRGVALGAHDADAAFDRGQRAGGASEFFGLHVIGVRGPYAAEGLAFPAVGDARGFDGSL